MASIRPFNALRPRPELAVRICELPYDVMSSDEARALAAGNSLSFLRVSKPEIDLPPGTNPYSVETYARAAENFARLIAQGALVEDAQPSLYLYRQIMGSHVQTGLVATFSCQEYLDGIIKKHELTRPDKEDDRVRHIEVLNAQTGPVFLTYRATAALDAWVSQRIGLPPAVDFVAPDGVRHSAWVIADPIEIERWEVELGRIPALYIADGHHRCAAAARVFQARAGAGSSARFLAVVFPHDQLQILPYHRVVKDLNGLSLTECLTRLDRIFQPLPPGASQPDAKHVVGFYAAGTWRRGKFREEYTDGATSALERLDVSLLQRHVLGPIFGIDDPRTSQRVSFVGGIRGTPELERLVNSGEFAAAFSLYPTRIEDLMAIADNGGIMPPKSTWFEPKLRDAMFCHGINHNGG